MSLRSRLLLTIASLLTLGAYVLPLWEIELQAPQYPEGLGMQIWVHTIKGVKPNDLDSINNLNHYIGMRKIVPDAIPELRFMPAILGALVLLGLVAAWSGRRPLVRAWLVAFIVLAALGMADFWKWGYDYGHNLDVENAIIKIPGMTYQPPLIGSKQLLNFRATSLPGPGAILMATAVLLGFVALALDSGRQAPLRQAGAFGVQDAALA
jgi:copper chaperone NosL